MSTDEKKLTKYIKSPEELRGAPTPSYIERVENRVAPLFSAEVGQRMQLVRMKMLLDQAQLGELLGTSQQQISKLERGHIEQAPFTLGRLRAVFGRNFHFILFGSDADAWNVRQIKKTFWDTKLRIRRKEGSGKWITEQRLAGKPEYWKKRERGSDEPPRNEKYWKLGKKGSK